jgi:hypothetical protein
MNPIVSHLLVAVSSLLLGIGMGRLSAKRFVGRKWDIFGGIAILVLVGVSLAGVLIGLKNYEHATNCDAIRTENLSKMVELQEEQVTSERRATLKMLGVILTAGTPVETRRTAVEEWETTLKNIDKIKDDASFLPECE